MIRLEALRAAVQSADPFIRLDRLIHEELTAGRTVRELIAAIRPVLDDVLDTPGLTADGEQAFLQTLDALSGDCHPDSRYRDTPTVSVAPPSAASVPPVVATVG